MSKSLCSIGSHSSGHYGSSSSTPETISLSPPKYGEWWSNENGRGRKTPDTASQNLAASWWCKRRTGQSSVGTWHQWAVGKIMWEDNLHEHSSSKESEERCRNLQKRLKSELIYSLLLWVNVWSQRLGQHVQLLLSFLFNFILSKFLVVWGFVYFLQWVLHSFYRWSEPRKSCTYGEMKKD